MEQLYAEIQMVVLSCAAAHSGALPPRRRKSSLSMQNDTSRTRQASAASTQSQGVGGRSPPGWVGGDAAQPRRGGEGGEAPWSRTNAQHQRVSPLRAVPARRTLRASCAAQPCQSPTRAQPQRYPKRKSRYGFRKGRRSNIAWHFRLRRSPHWGHMPSRCPSRVVRAEP